MPPRPRPGPPLYRIELLRLTRHLGDQFKRRGMEAHLQAARIYYLVLSHGLDSRGTVQIHWTRDLVEEWMGNFQLGRFADRYPVASAARCPGCQTRASNASPNSHVEAVWPGGARHKCHCGQEWISLHRS